MVPILILAAGASTRMRGRDKLLEPVGTEPLLRRVAKAALTSGQSVLVALPPGAVLRRVALAGLPVELLTVADATTGMAASIRAGVAALPATATGLLLMLADMPDIGPEDIHALLNAHDGTPDAPILRAAAMGGEPGHPVLFPARFFPQLRGLTGDAGARAILSDPSAPVQLIPLPGRRAVTDLDTPEDWDRWRAANPT